jgi:hypothetical protein
MKDQLEDFVRQNRKAFDDKEPSRRVWTGIEASLRMDSRSWNKPVVLWRAAAIFFMALSAYLLIPKEPMRAEHALALKEFTDVEEFYVQQISNKVELIGEFKGSDGLNGFTHDFEQLEAMYMVLREEMKTRPSEKVKDALVLNLLVRIDLLNQHLQRLEEKVKPGGEPAEEEARKS